jgi:hypothetical protein
MTSPCVGSSEKSVPHCIYLLYKATVSRSFQNSCLRFFRETDHLTTFNIGENLRRDFANRDVENELRPNISKGLR